MLSKNTFGMELDTFYGQSAVTQAHDDVACFVACAGGDLQLIGQTLCADDERVVACAGDFVRYTLEDRLAIVFDKAGLAVHQFWRADDVAAEGCADGLVAEANAQNWRADVVLRIVLDDPDGRSRFLRGAGTGGDEDAVGLHGRNLFGRDFIVATDDDIYTVFAHVLDQVVGEGVVVVENKYHDLLFYSGCGIDIGLRGSSILKHHQLNDLRKIDGLPHDLLRCRYVLGGVHGFQHTLIKLVSLFESLTGPRDVAHDQVDTFSGGT